MAEFRCDSKEVEAALEKLAAGVEAAGGFISENLTVIAEKGDLSISAPAGTAETLVTLTEACLMPVEECTFGLEGDDLVLRDVSQNMTPGMRGLFEAKIELFNLTRKIARLRAASPWVAFAGDIELLDRIIAGRPNLRFIEKFYADARAGRLEALAINAFLKTRTLKFLEGRRVLMPFVNFANHHFEAPGYQFRTEPGRGPTISLITSEVPSKSGECFVQYGPYDAYDLYINHGFVEDSAPFVRSIPLIITLPGVGEINVAAFLGATFEGELPAHVADLRPFIPVLMNQSKTALQITHLLIPGALRRDALRRILQEFIQLLRPDLTYEALGPHIEEAERQVLEKNIEFYRNLKDHLKTRPASTATVIARTMADIQLGKLGDYKMQ